MEPMQFTRFSFPSTTDQQAALWIASILCPIYSVILLIVRYTLRRKIRKSDTILCSAYLLAVIEWSFVWAALLKGVGKSTTVISGTALADASRFVYASVTVALLVIATTTTSQCFFLAEFTPNRHHRRVCYGAAFTAVVLVLAALLILLVGCSSTRYLYHESSPEAACHGQVRRSPQDRSDSVLTSRKSTRWIIGGVLLGLATSMPAILPPILFHNVQTSWGHKAHIYSVFGITLLCVPLIALVVVYFNIFNRGSQDSITAVRFFMLLQILLVWCFASATFPVSRPIALKFNTSRAQLQDTSLYGAGTKRAFTRVPAQGRSYRAKDQSQLRTKRLSRIIHSSRSTRLRQSGSGDDTASNDSERQFIRKTVEVIIGNDEA